MLNNEDLVEDEIKKVTKSSVKRVQFGSDEGQSDDQDEDDDGNYPTSNDDFKVRYF